MISKKIKKNVICLTMTLIFAAFSFALNVSAQQVFVANLSGAQEVPAVTTSGKGVCKVVLNAAQTQISLNCTYSGLSSNATSAHIHGNAPVGVNAPVLFDLGAVSSVSGTITASAINVTPAQVADMRMNRLYVNIHTANNTGGEIRGQLHIANSAFNDHDGDGRSDLTVYRPATSYWYSKLSTNGTLKARRLSISNGISAQNVDFDGDGISDYALAQINPQTGGVTFFILQSATETERQVQFGNVALGDQIATGDYDGDGSADLGYFRQGLWVYIESSTGQTKSFSWGQTGDINVQGDFDRDGKTDFTVVRSEGGRFNWYIRQSSNGQLKAFTYGASTDLIFAPTDIDGDGAADAIVSRGTGGVRSYFMLRSSDNQTMYLNWGFTSDTPKTGDFDGDGKLDFAALRDMSGLWFWYIYQSSNGQLRAEQWGLSTDF